MPTTIQVSDSTKRILEMLKEKEKADSYDAVISKIAKEKLKLPKSMFGRVKLTPYSREKDRLKTREY